MINGQQQQQRMVGIFLLVKNVQLTGNVGPRKSTAVGHFWIARSLEVTVTLQPS